MNPETFIAALIGAGASWGMMRMKVIDMDKSLNTVQADIRHVIMNYASTASLDKVMTRLDTIDADIKSLLSRRHSEI